MKKEFKGYAVVDYAGNDWHFKLWEKGDKRRVYVSRRNKQSAGYIDLITMKCVCSYLIEKEAMNLFLESYAV